MLFWYSGLLHISNISKGRIRSINEVLKIGEEVKVLVVKSIIADRIALRFVSSSLFYYFLFVLLLIIVLLA